MVSIIVPIYNRDKYLWRCVDSILCQTYSDIEVLLVDDGSSDGSGRICEEYAAMDSRVQVLHQQNAGSSVSRIRGIEKAHGDYIQFVDSDDWIEPTIVECLLVKAQKENVDVVWCNYMVHTPEQSEIHVPFDNRPSVMLNAIYDFKISGCLWNKLYRAEVLRHLTPSDVDIREDVFYATQILVQNPSMSFVDKALYHYDMMSSDSLIRKDDRDITCIPNYVHCYNYLVSKGCFSIYKSSFAKRVLKSKICLLNKGQYKDAQVILPFANFAIQNYPVAFPISIIYWIGINCGAIGRFLISIYFSKKKFKSIC